MVLLRRNILMLFIVEPNMLLPLLLNVRCLAGLLDTIHRATWSGMQLGTAGRHLLGLFLDSL